MLLDTQVLLWLRLGDSRLGPEARNLIEEVWQLDEIAVSAISFWEVAMLASKGRIRLSESVSTWRLRQLEEGVIEIPLDGATAVRAGLLSEMHGDPADRIIVATALGGHKLMTADQRILDWPGSLARLDARE